MTTLGSLTLGSGTLGNPGGEPPEPPATTSTGGTTRRRSSYNHRAPEPPVVEVEVDARFGTAAFTTKITLEANGRAQRQGQAAFTERARTTLAASGHGTLCNDDDDLILLGIL